MIAVVLGAALGDEGKGVLTDYLCHQLRPGVVNVRFSGSAQAGHTVVTPEGDRHVFHHFGAGTFAGAMTQLGPEFIVNPILFVREQEELAALSVSPPAVLVSPSCRIATPFDMWLNQTSELLLGGQRHGSCGVGVNETMQRDKAGVTFSVDDLFGWTEEAIRRRLCEIRDEYLPRRLAEMGVGSASVLQIEQPDWLVGPRVIEHFMEDLEMFRLTAVEMAVPRTGNLVFEGAQGLRLDMYSLDYPHVTHARTGLANVLASLNPLDGMTLDVYYVTRCYTTRHGAGPLAGEWAISPYPGIVDETNVTNEWQQGLRLAPLDVDRLVEDIQRDAWYADAAHAAGLIRAVGMDLRVHVVMTCVDQLQGDYVQLLDGRVLPPGVVLDELAGRVRAVEALMVSGRTRNDVVQRS